MVHLIGSPICDQRLNRNHVRPVRPIWLESDRFVEASTRPSESAGRALFRQRRYARKSPGQDVEPPPVPSPAQPPSSSLNNSTRETCLSVTFASSSRKSTTLSSNSGARTAARAAGLLR